MSLGNGTKYPVSIKAIILLTKLRKLTPKIPVQKSLKEYKKIEFRISMKKVIIICIIILGVLFLYFSNSIQKNMDKDTLSNSNIKTPLFQKKQKLDFKLSIAEIRGDSIKNRFIDTSFYLVDYLPDTILKIVYHEKQIRDTILEKLGYEYIKYYPPKGWIILDTKSDENYKYILIYWYVLGQYGLLNEVLQIKDYKILGVNRLPRITNDFVPYTPNEHVPMGDDFFIDNSKDVSY